MATEAAVLTPPPVEAPKPPRVEVPDAQAQAQAAEQARQAQVEHNAGEIMGADVQAEGPVEALVDLAQGETIAEAVQQVDNSSNTADRVASEARNVSEGPEVVRIRAEEQQQRAHAELTSLDVQVKPNSSVTELMTQLQERGWQNDPATRGYVESAILYSQGQALSQAEAGGQASNEAAETGEAAEVSGPVVEAESQPVQSAAEQQAPADQTAPEQSPGTPPEQSAPRLPDEPIQVILSNKALTGNITNQPGFRETQDAVNNQYDESVRQAANGGERVQPLTKLQLRDIAVQRFYNNRANEMMAAGGADLDKTMKDPKLNKWINQYIQNERQSSRNPNLNRADVNQEAMFRYALANHLLEKDLEHRPVWLKILEKLGIAGFVLAQEAVKLVPIGGGR